MMRFVHGNIFDSKAQTLVNTVNCVGVMGKGLAKEFRDRFPEMYEEYRAACRRKELRSGRPFHYKDLHTSILCIPTKDNWKGPSKYEFIDAGLRAVRENYQEWGITSLAVPPLGCGLGGLEWPKVKALIVQHLGNLSIDIEVYEPTESDQRIALQSRKRVVKPVNITIPLAIVGEIIRRARHAMPAEVALGKIHVQKFAFFSQVAGAPIKLRFDKYKYGPYDHNLNHMIERLEGLYFRDESTTWKRSDLRILDEEAWLKAIEPLSAEMKRFSKYIDSAVDLLKARTLDEVELLASLQYGWCATVASGLAGDDQEIEDYIESWSKEKRAKFPPDRIREALAVLREAGWLGPLGPGSPSPLTDPTPEPGEAVLA